MSRVLQTVLVVGLVLCCRGSARSVGAQSPPQSDLPWMNTSLSPEQRADLLIQQMTLEQKVQQLSNDVRPLLDPANRPDGCKYERIARFILGIPALAIPSVRMTNGGTGLRGGSCLPQPEATAVPSASAIGAAFNPALARQLGEVLGDEARLWGHQVLLGPLMNLVRHPYGGRNFDFPGEDPYLSGVMSVETIKGIQAQGVHAVPKHIVGNEQETDRNGGDSVIPPRALHELYLLPFEMSAKDGEMAGIMCAYNRVNGVSACSNAELLNTTLRQQWGWNGYVVTDRRALHDLAPSIKAGADWELAHETPHYYALEPQPGNSRQGPSEGIRAALEAGSITLADLDQMLRRRYVQMFKFGQFETNFDVTFEATPDFITNGLVAREIAEQGIVLLKNQDTFLPLDAGAINSVALIGATWYAGMAKMAPLSLNAENANVDAPYTVTPKKGLENVLRSLGSAATVTYESGGGTGTQADIDRAVALARKSDVVIVMAGDNPYEVCDVTPRLPIIPPADKNFCAYQQLTPGTYELSPAPRGKGTDQEALLQALTADPAIARKMVVVLKTEGMVLMPWLDKVPALVEAWYPGQEDGNAVANVLFGLRNPSGKLPMTFGIAAREAAYSTPEQFPGVWEPAPPWEKGKVLSPHYTEDLQVGYRWFEAHGVTPLFPFGFGLSYTTFGYSGLSVTPAFDAHTGAAVLTVTYTITNTGSREGAEASQVYVTLPPAAGQPSKRLVGFHKVDLMPGASQQVSITIDSAASNHPLSYWVPINDAPTPGWSNGSWRSAPGDYTVHVGSSSADTPLLQTVTIPFPEAPVPGRAGANFSGGPASDIAVWRPDSGTWYIKRAVTNFTDSMEVQWGTGQFDDQPVPADYDGDGVADVAVWRNADGVWYVKTASTQFSQSFTVQWGTPGDRPFPGDFDGDHKADLVVWRPSTGVWHVLTSSSGYQTSVTLQWGLSDDIPVPADFDGDGRMDPAVWRPGTSVWYVLPSASNYVAPFTVPWGAGSLGDVPLAGDFDGDRRADIAFWRPGTGVWSVTLSSTAYKSSFNVQWGTLGDVPVVVDSDGDGRTDIAVWRPGDGVWYVKPSRSGYASSFTVQWGLGSLQDRPIGGVPPQDRQRGKR